MSNDGNDEVKRSAVALSSHDLDQNSGKPVNNWKRREVVSMLQRGLELMQAVN